YQNRDVTEPQRDGDRRMAVDEVLSQYPDFDTVAEYAKEAVTALISAGLVNGKNGKIAPTDYTTRAEVAVLIKRILDFIK
ncbi:MAG: S-layer homology domain-containing protein, partial [Oscillospiraceae bacterium]|nr:S-layer homology domain-containing protein [Oscillospiraceae bacterium]